MGSERKQRDGGEGEGFAVDASLMLLFVAFGCMIALGGTWMYAGLFCVWSTIAACYFVHSRHGAR